MTQVAIDDRLVQDAQRLYPEQSLETVTMTALKRFLAAQEFMQMKGILTEDDFWPDEHKEAQRDA